MIKKVNLGYIVFFIALITSIILIMTSMAKVMTNGNNSKQITEFNTISTNNSARFDKNSSKYGLGPYYDSRGNNLQGGTWTSNTKIIFHIMTLDSKTNIFNMTPIASYTAISKRPKQKLLRSDKIQKMIFNEQNLKLSPSITSNIISVNDVKYYLAGITYNDDEKNGLIDKNNIFWFHKRNPTKQFLETNIYFPVVGVRKIDINLLYVASN